LLNWFSYQYNVYPPLGGTALSKICFVIGPIGSPGHEIRLAADDFIEYIVAPCVRELGYDKPLRADTLPEPGRITAQIIELLNSADLVIADLSGGNENVYYELSCRHAIGRPVIHMALEGTRLPFDVADNRTIFYSMHARQVEIARVELRRQVARVHEPGYKVRSPIIDAIGLITLERSTEPTQQLLAQLTREMESLRADMGDLRSRLTSSQTSPTEMLLYPGAGKSHAILFEQEARRAEIRAEIERSMEQHSAAKNNAESSSRKPRAKR
jgi:hypothetical protein